MLVRCLNNLVKELTEAALIGSDDEVAPKEVLSPFLHRFDYSIEFFMIGGCSPTAGAQIFAKISNMMIILKEDRTYTCIGCISFNNESFLEVG